MALNSFTFVVFLVGVAALVRVLARFHVPAARVALLVASTSFYAFGQRRYVVFLAASILFNFWIARRLAPEAGGARSRWLKLALAVNIMVLAGFKYTAFGVSAVAPWIGGLSVPAWAFPLGISFFTLQQVMYLVDCYEGLVPAHSLMDHALFVSFFPYITAGPISRSRLMTPQFRKLGEGRDLGADLERGLVLFVGGVMQKAILADTLGRLVDVGYGDPTRISHTGAWICSLGYSLQIYFDFSGYSDMAIGAALILGFDIPKNFNAPLHARSVSDFWQRWHITLSQFITTYLYTPLVRRAGRVTVHRAAFVTLVAMTIAGLWHGPAVNFIIFGIIHGVGLATNQYWKKYKPAALPPVLAWAATMLLVNVAFIFFRTKTLGDALHVCRMLLPGGEGPSTDFVAAVRASEIASFAWLWGAAVVVAALEPSAKLASVRRAGAWLSGAPLGSHRRYWMFPLLAALVFGALLFSAAPKGVAPIIYAVF